MKNYISANRAAYEDYYHGQFSKKLAQWAINNMKAKDANGNMRPIQQSNIESVMQLFQMNNIQIDGKMKYTAWYLFNMARADYPTTLVNDAQRVKFVYETLLDPDCCPEAVLECFTAKMCTMGEPIFWEDFI